MLEKSRQLFLQWNSSSICYCHWKSNEHLIEGLDGKTDLDILLDRKDKEKGHGILTALEFIYCKSQFGSRYVDVEDWIGFDENTGNLIHVHLHYCMITGHKGMKEYHLPWTKDVLQTRIFDKETGVYVSDPNLEIITLYSRIGLKATVKRISKAKKGKFILDEDYRKEIKYLKDRIQWTEVYVYLQNYYGKDSDVMLSIMQSSNIDSSRFLQLKRITMRNMTTYCNYSRIGVVLREFYYRIVQRSLSWIKYKYGFPIILRKIPTGNKGLTVAFLGQDGAGKSSVTVDIEKWLRWKLDATRFYLGSGDHFEPWEKKVRKCLQKFHLLSKPLRAILLFRQYIKLSKTILKTIRKANFYTNKGGIALYDRFPQVIYNGINDGPKIESLFMDRMSNSIFKKIVGYYSSKEERILKKAVEYQPDVVIKLMLPPDESIRRKPKENPILVRRKYEIIKSLEFNSSNVYEVNATQKYEEELLQIKQIMWNNIQNDARFKME